MKDTLTTREVKAYQEYAKNSITKRHIYHSNTKFIMFKKLSKMKFRHQTLFALVISFAVISFWRGLWGLMDMYLLPNNYILSLWVSMFMGLSILAITHYVTKELL